MLHIVNKSPFERNNLATCLRLAKAGSDILLIEDAVYGILSNASQSPLLDEHLTHFNIYALQPDLAARGITEESLIPEVSLIDYDGFVELTENNTNIQSWL